MKATFGSGSISILQGIGTPVALCLLVVFLWPNRVESLFKNIVDISPDVVTIAKPSFVRLSPRIAIAQDSIYVQKSLLGINPSEDVGRNIGWRGHRSIWLYDNFAIPQAYRAWFSPIIRFIWKPSFIRKRTSLHPDRRNPSERISTIIRRINNADWRSCNENLWQTGTSWRIAHLNSHPCTVHLRHGLMGNPGGFFDSDPLEARKDSVGECDGDHDALGERWPFRPVSFLVGVVMIAVGFRLIVWSYDPIWLLMYSGSIGKGRAIAAFIAGVLIVGTGFLLALFSLPTRVG